MRPRTTIILFLLVAALGTFVYFWERHQQNTLERRADLNLTAMDLAEVDGMVIKNASGTVKFKKRPSDGVWLITEPFDDRLDPALAQRLLDLAKSAEVVETLSRKDLKDSDRTAFGLDDQNAYTIAWRGGDKTLGRLKIGKIGAFGDTVYAEAPGKKDRSDIYLLLAKPDAKTTHFRDEMSRPIAEMRDQLLLPFKSQSVVGLAIRHPGSTGEIAVQRQLIPGREEATPWSISKPLKARGDQHQIDDLVGLFTSARVTSLLPPGPDPSGLPPAPAVELEFQFEGEGKPCAIRLYPPATPEAASVTGYLTDRKAWFTIEAGFLQAIPKSPNDLRANTLADLDAKKITTILIDNVGGESINLYRIGQRWGLLKPDKTFIKASNDRVAKTIKALNEAEIGKYVTDSLTTPADYGLDHPFQTITFATPEHDPKLGLGAVTPENSLVLQFGKGPDERLYANFKGEPSVFLMFPDHYGIVPAQSLKWRDLQILDFARPSVRRLQQTKGSEPPVILTSPPRSFDWKATRADADVTPLLAREAVERLLGRLSNLNVSDWISGLTEGHQALQNPTLELEVDVEYFPDPTSTDKAQLKTIQLSFAPSGDGKQALFYIGHCTDISDYFYINREIYSQLAAPLLKAKAP